MKISLLLLLIGLFAIVSCNKYSGNAAAGSGSSSLNGEIDSVSYAIGVDLANMVVRSNIKEINATAFMDGFTKVMNNDTANLKIKVLVAGNVVRGYLAKQEKLKAEKNKKDGAAFLAENKKKPGVKVLPSGVQYIVIKQGNGPIPVDTSMVKAHYHGTLIDGTVFDSSVDRKQPAEFPVRGVIQGWQEILKMMPVGSKWKVFIPENLAYGDNVRPGGKIEPGMTLIFEIELLEIINPNKPSNANQNSSSDNTKEEQQIEGD